MTALTIAPEEELSWEINDPNTYYPSRTLSKIYRPLPDIPPLTTSRYVVPRALSVNLGFTVLYDRPPNTSTSVFKSVTNGLTGGY